MLHVRDHGRIPCAYWTSAEIQPLAVDPKLLGAYLLTCEHGTIAGAFRLPVGYVADDLKWSSERVSEGFMELSRIGFINRCETSNWVWLRKYLEWNAPENPNQWKAIRKVVALIPSRRVGALILLDIYLFCLARSQHLHQTLLKRLPKPFRNQE